MKRTLVFAYGVACYLVFLATFVYAIGFLGNLVVPKTIDSAPEGSAGRAFWINAGLLGAFALQHSIMARRWFKRAWTRVVPPAAERSTYVLASSILLILLFAFWQPMGGVIWDVGSGAGRIALQTLYGCGWLVVLASTFLINHFDLFGLRQVHLHLRGKPYTQLAFRTPLFYRHVRHPLYVGWLCVFWAAPTMTVAHLLFAVLTTGYILVAIRFEERDLIRIHGEDYRLYRERVPMLLPIGRRDAPIAPEPSGQSA